MIKMINKSFITGLLMTGGFFISCKEDPKAHDQIVQEPISFKKEAELILVGTSGDTLQKLDIEIADDDYQRETGLMYRRQLAEHQGMLFVFPEEAQRGFYMKNTYIPLDLIFLDADRKIVNIYNDAAPESMKTIRSEFPAQYVLEINAGLADQWGLKPGARIILRK